MEFLKVIILANQYSECQGVWSGHMETLHETTPPTHQEVKDPLERLHESSVWVNLSGRRKRLACHPTLKHHTFINTWKAKNWNLSDCYSFILKCIYIGTTGKFIFHVIPVVGLSLGKIMQFWAHLNSTRVFLCSSMSANFTIFIKTVLFLWVIVLAS